MVLDATSRIPLKKEYAEICEWKAVMTKTSDRSNSGDSRESQRSCIKFALPSIYPLSGVFAIIFKELHNVSDNGESAFAEDEDVIGIKTVTRHRKTSRSMNRR